MPKMKLVFKKEGTDEIYTTTDIKNVWKTATQSCDCTHEAAV
jgi:hypothetical protein